MATNKVLLTKAASNSKTLQQIADDVVAKVAGSSLIKILVSQDTIIFDNVLQCSMMQDNTWLQTMPYDHIW